MASLAAISRLSLWRTKAAARSRADSSVWVVTDLGGEIGWSALRRGPAKTLMSAAGRASLPVTGSRRAHRGRVSRWLTGLRPVSNHNGLAVTAGVVAPRDRQTINKEQAAPAFILWTGRREAGWERTAVGDLDAHGRADRDRHYETGLGVMHRVGGQLRYQQRDHVVGAGSTEDIHYETAGPCHRRAGGFESSTGRMRPRPGISPTAGAKRTSRPMARLPHLQVGNRGLPGMYSPETPGVKHHHRPLIQETP
jgi:hypothetical protein